MSFDIEGKLWHGDAATLATRSVVWMGNFKPIIF